MANEDRFVLVDAPISLSDTHTTRRNFLAGSGLALTSLAAMSACGSGSSSGSSDGGKNGNVIVNFFSDGFFVPGRQRLPIGLGDKSGVLQTGGPKTLKGRVVDELDKEVVSNVVVNRHDDGVPRPYYPVFLELAVPGVYRLEMNIPGGRTQTAFTVTDPSKVKLPKPGDKMRPFLTPTATDGRGVNPICTRNPFCDMHKGTLTDALLTGKPVAFLISTPAHCQKAVCGPILDLVAEQVQRLSDKVVGVHAEVYTDDSINDVSPAVDGYDLLFEPSLWLADKSGTVVERYDVIFDRVEMKAAFDRLVA
jgi:hypothetical protein